MLEVGAVSSFHGLDIRHFGADGCRNGIKLGCERATLSIGEAAALNCADAINLSNEGGA